MVYVTKRLEFCAAHKLSSDQLSDEENKEIFGACYNGPGHGHNYTLEVTVTDHETDKKHIKYQYL